MEEGSYPCYSPVIYNCHTFFVPCFLYVTPFGMRERSRQLFSQNCIALQWSEPRLVDNRARLSQLRNCEPSRDYPNSQDLKMRQKEEDPPPSYEEIMHKETIPEEPPPPYRAL
ncbi:hypothetical protein CEXT_643141 [Caerostris extrusa]|uniref:Uncharacterized protein n=1 Tax=Caerostris extrusa TaxID=172846 RepID=A0AAV4Y562_CAEEX|nr:hypothetical protein CEXT_643141 [Caerostris extrusa]